MRRAQTIIFFATVLLLLLTVEYTRRSYAQSKPSGQVDVNLTAGETYDMPSVSGGAILMNKSPSDAYFLDNPRAPGDIIPGDRQIDWALTGIPGGIPERTTVCSTIDNAVYGTGTVDATGVIQSALDACPDGQVVYLPEGTYLATDTIHLYDYDTLRGAGPGKTILKYEGGWVRSLVDMRGSVYWQIASLHKTYDVIEGNKDAFVITLDGTTGISPGDILLINQLNDNDIVDPVGVEGKCTYCGYEGGDRVLGQFVEVVAVYGNQVTLNLPLHWTYDPSLDPWAYQVDAYAMVRHAGLEDLTLTQDEPDIEFMIEMDGAQYSWIKNVELENIQRRGMWVINSLQNEIRETYIHLGLDGYGRDRGYGILLDAHSSNNLVEDNVLSTIDGGGIMAAGGASGNVFAYNYFHDIRFDDPWWLIASPSISHAPHPKMNLWEGNIAYKAEADIIHGSSSHNTIFRAYSKGWQNETITTRNNAIEIAAKNTYMNVVGSVLGTPGRSNRYEVLPGQPYDDWTDYVIWTLGVGSGVEDPNVAATLLRHGNYDFVTASVVWDANIPDHSLPDSMYLDAIPDWWCLETPWPPIGPDVVGYHNKIPAQRRFEGLPCTRITDLVLRGIAAEQTIYLDWEVNAAIPLTATWKLTYEGPPGDQPSPIPDLINATRAYTLTGLTNYTVYTVTLNATLDAASIMTATVRAMPSDIFVYLPEIAR